MAIASPTRYKLVRRGRQLEYFTIAYNSAEGLISIVAGIIAGSVSLIGFGLDSLIEVTSGAALLWRLHHDLNPSRREHVERITQKIVGWCFVALASYIAYESASTLIRHQSPERSIPGIIVAAVSVVVMPVLARAKRRVAAGIGSSAMNADSRQADFCTYLSAILLGGLLLNALLGWWWSDPVAGLVMFPIIGKEGVDGLRGKACCDSCGCPSERRCTLSNLSPATCVFTLAVGALGDAVVVCTTEVNMGASCYRIRKAGKWIDEFSYGTFEQACWVWTENPGGKVVEIDIATQSERQCSTEESREQLRRSPRPTT